MLPTYFLSSSPSSMLSPLYLSPPLLFSLSHTHSPGLLQSHSSPSNLYLGAMLEAPTHSHQAFQCIPTGCIAYHKLALLTHILMHAQNPHPSDTFEDTQVYADSHVGELHSIWMMGKLGVYECVAHCGVSLCVFVCVCESPWHITRAQSGKTKDNS